MTEPGSGRPDPHQETVHQPHSDPDPPTRSPQPVVWLVIAAVAVLVLVVALVVAAVQAST